MARPVPAAQADSLKDAAQEVVTEPVAEVVTEPVAIIESAEEVILDTSVILDFSKPRMVVTAHGGQMPDPFTGHVYGPSPSPAQEGGWLDAQIAAGKLRDA